MTPDIGTLHFTGIGGIGMSGIAEILLSLGYTVQGSDMAENANVLRLRDQGVKIEIGHAASNIQNTSAVIMSSAIKPDNPELIAAKAAGIPIVRRAQMLAELMRLKSAIAVGGTHGKTTTTAMIGQMLQETGFDPTVINGGIVNAYGTNARLGQSNLMVVEADESDGTFTRLPACVTVVTNIDAEHMDHYEDFDAVRDAYARFIKNVPFYGYAVLCIDHPEVQALIPKITDRRIITYGFSSQADIRASNVKPSAKGNYFDVTIAPRLTADGQGAEIKDMFLPMPGRHNVENALVSIAIAQEMDVAIPLMRAALEKFTGVKRRFTQTGIVEGITIIDDYAHHPVEIETVLKAARDAAKEEGGKVIAIMQPHRYTRLRDLFEGFSTCFNDADTVLITPVYAASESPIEGISHITLATSITAHGHSHALSTDDMQALPTLIAKTARAGDYVICLGAGDITTTANDLPEQLKSALQTQAA